MGRPRKPPSPFRRFNSSPEVMRLDFIMYVHFPLSNHVLPTVNVADQSRIAEWEAWRTVSDKTQG